MIKKIIILLFIVLNCNKSLLAQSYTLTIDDNGEDVNVSSTNSSTSDYTSGTIRFSRSSKGFDVERAFIKFNLGALDRGVDILSAHLKLYGVSHDISYSGNGILQMVPKSWRQDNIDWDKSELLKSSEFPSIQIPEPSTTTQNYVLDVKNMVQTMINTPLIDFGWMFYMDESATGNKYFEFGSLDNSNSALRPVLEIEYADHLIVNAYVSPASNPSSANAGVSLSVINGVPPYTYLWDNSVTTKDVYNIEPGLHKVIITDSRGHATGIWVPVTSECGVVTFVLAPFKEPHGGYKSAAVSFVKGDIDVYAQNSNKIWPLEMVAGSTSTHDGDKTSRSLFGFDLKALPNNMQVNSATLVLKNKHAPYDTPFTVQLARADASWDERLVTYKEIDPAVDDAINFDYDATQSTYNIDVTSHMQRMLGSVNSANGWFLKLADENNAGAGNVASFGNDVAMAGEAPQLTFQATYNNVFCDDTQLNWNQEDVYDQSGNIISSQKNYLDNLGRSTQQLVKNATNEVFRSQTLYDSYGNPALTTLPAYTGNQLKFTPGFMRNTAAQVYGLNDFDVPSTYNSPSPLETGVNNTLGNYYSINNSYDPYQATAENPYTRTKFAGNPNGAPISVSKPGTAFKPGSGKESYSFNMVSGNELRYIFGYIGGESSEHYSYKVTRNSADKMDCIPIVVEEPIIANKQIVITPDNAEMITYSSGGKVIATCYNGLSVGERCVMTTIKNVMEYKGTKSTDIHLPDANKTSLKFLTPDQGIPGQASLNYRPNYKITDLYTDRLLVSGTDYNLVGTIPTDQYSDQYVVFTSAFLSQYTGRSLMLRISYEYSPVMLYNYDYFWHVQPANATILYDLSYGNFSKNYYDLGGSLRKSVSPKGFDCATPSIINMATTYDYNHFGQPIAKKSPDEGLVEMNYDKEGKLRFSQNAEQKIARSFSYVNYDKHGRVVETGENKSAPPLGSGFNNYSVVFANYYVVFTSGSYGTNDIINDPDGLYPTEKTNVTRTGYTVPAAADDVPLSYSSRAQYRSFRNGQVNFIKNNNSTVWNNYDAFGRSLASITQVTEADFITKQTSVDDQVKTTQVTFNPFTGLTTSNLYQRNNSNEMLEYRYSYDANYRPLTTQLLYGSTTENLSTNSYNKLGQLKRVVLGNNYQGMDYLYTLNGGLKAINNPALNYLTDPGQDNTMTSSGANPDIFGEVIEYYPNDYISRNTNLGSPSIQGANYDGLIYGVRFKTRDVVNGQNTGANYINKPLSQETLINTTNYEHQELRFAYTYDEYNRLGTSTFGLFNNQTNAFNLRTEFRESGASGGNIAYDKNGNITSLLRKAYVDNGSLINLDNLAYTNGTTNNKLTGIVDAAVNPFTSAINFKTPSTSVASAFVYNTIGQLTQSAAEGIQKISYFPTGKIRTISFTNGNISEFEYGAAGEKLKSKFYDAAANRRKYTWYVGPYIYEFDSAVASPVFRPAEVKVSGGTLRIPTGNSVSLGYMVYHITDHLGNIRATFKKSNTGAANAIDILSYNDYYAFGGQIPGRSWTASGDACRYGYQGQEKAKDNTLWDQFELRSYNHDIGRWSAPDPYGQFNSPYIAMANNPVSNIDPDGGQVPLFDPNNIPRGKQEDDRQRSSQSGAYSYAEVRKRYLDEYENLRQNILQGNNTIGTGARGNVDAYLKAVYALNENYAGLVNSFHGGMGGPGYGTGQEYLLQSELNVNVMAAQRNGAQVAGLTTNELRDRMKQDNQMSSTEGWARDVEGRAKGSSDLIQGLRMTYNPPLKDTRTEGLGIFGFTGKIINGNAEENVTLKQMIDVGSMGEESNSLLGECLVKYNYSQPPPCDINASGNDVVKTLISAMRYEYTQGTGGINLYTHYFPNAVPGVVYNFTNIDINSGGTQIKMETFSISFNVLPSGKGTFNWTRNENIDFRLNLALECRDDMYRGAFKSGLRSPRNTPQYNMMGFGKRFE